MLALAIALAAGACGGGQAPSAPSASPSVARSAAPATDDPAKTYPKASQSPDQYYGY